MKYIAYQAWGAHGIEQGDEARVISRERSPDGATTFMLVRDNADIHTIRLSHKDFNLTFKQEYESKSEQRRVEATMPGANEVLGLPRHEKMQKVAICFDVDGTIIDHMGRPRLEYLMILVALNKAFKNSKLVIWSGGGNQYAQDRARQLGIDHLAWKFMSKHQHTELRALGYQILAVDDIQDTALGDINLIVRQ